MAARRSGFSIDVRILIKGNWLWCGLPPQMTITEILELFNGVDAVVDVGGPGTAFAVCGTDAIANQLIANGETRVKTVTQFFSETDGTEMVEMLGKLPSFGKDIKTMKDPGDEIEVRRHDPRLRVKQDRSSPRNRHSPPKNK